MKATYACAGLCQRLSEWLGQRKGKARVEEKLD